MSPSRTLVVLSSTASLAAASCAGAPPPEAPPPAYSAARPSTGPSLGHSTGPGSPGGEPTLAPTGGPPSSVEGPVQQGPPPPGGYRQVFVTRVAGWNRQVVIAPWGDVVALSGEEAVLLARDSGEVLARLPVCVGSGQDSAAFVDDRRLLVACEEGVHEVVFPAVKSRRVFDYPFHDPYRLKVAAIGGGRLVAAVDNFFAREAPDTRVRVYDTTAFKLVDEFDVGKPVEAVALSPDGARAAVDLDDDSAAPGLVVRELAARTSRSLLEGQGLRPKALRFSPDGARLFGQLGTFEAGELDVRDGGRTSTFRIGSWLTTVRYVPGGTVVASGSDGLSLFPANGTTAALKGVETGEGLDASPDGSYLCVGSRDGTVACFAKGPVAPSTFVRPALGATPPTVEAPGARTPGDGARQPASDKVALDGTLAARSGKTLVVVVRGAEAVAVGRKGRLSKSFSQDLGGVAVSGKLQIAAVSVVAVAKDRVTLSIDEEKSSVVVNGKKVDHFAANTPVTLDLD